MGYLELAYQNGTSFLLPVWMLLDRVRFLTPYQADVLQTFAMIAIILVVIKAWTSTAFTGSAKILAISLTGPIGLTLLFHAEDAKRGVPDDNCARYNNGRLTFVFLSHVEVPISRTEIGDNYVILTVLGPQRWGDETHQCRLRFSDPKIKDLIAKIKAQLEEGNFDGGTGEITFSFGSTVEKPNVTFKPRQPPGVKDVAPEVVTPKDA